MLFNCTHTFTLDADDRADFEAKLARYSKRVRDASAKLDIGYSAGIMFGQAASDRPRVEPEPEKAPERLFDD